MLATMSTAPVHVRSRKLLSIKTLTTSLLVSPALAQSGLWEKVNGYKPPSLRQAALSKGQKRLISRTIAAYEATASQDWGQSCTVSELVDGSTWERLPVSSGHNVLLVEAGTCARGGQGSNGAMWVIRLGGTNPVILASPAQQFSGWIYSVQPSTGFGYRDLVLGWHMSAAESSLSYFRFDGKFYRCIGHATADRDDNEITKIIPANTGARQKP